MLEPILVGDNDAYKRKIARRDAQGGAEGALVRVARGGRSAGGCQGCLCGGFGPHNCMLFDAGPLGPMHGRSGAAGRMCLDRTPSIGTRVLSSVSAFGVCSFALGAQHVSESALGVGISFLTVLPPPGLRNKAPPPR